MPTLESSKLFGDQNHSQLSATPKQMQMGRMSKVSNVRDEQKEQKMKRAEEIKR